MGRQVPHQVLQGDSIVGNAFSLLWPARIEPKSLAIFRLRSGTPPRAVDKIIQKLDLAEYADRRAGFLSHGNAQRLGLAKAFLHSPKLLILDEPANGLDPAGIVEIRELLLELTHEQGVTVFMSRSSSSGTQHRRIGTQPAQTAFIARSRNGSGTPDFG